MAAARAGHSATLLPNGKVLVVGGTATGGAYLTSAELYDPASGTWTLTGTLNVSRYSSGMTFLTSGKVLIAGGYNGTYLSSSELYDPGLGYSTSGQPKITLASPKLSPDNGLTLGGSGFRGLSGASTGSYQDSPTNYPVVQLMAMGSGQTTMLPPSPTQNWSDTAFTANPLSTFPYGYALATVFTNGIPSASVIVSVGASSVADLSNLALSTGTLVPTFNSNTTIYNASVPLATTAVTVTPTTAAATATVKVNGAMVISGSASAPITLSLGANANVISTVVTAQDGTFKTYMVTVTRTPSSNANLANLTLSAGNLNPAFASATTTYNANVPDTTSSITVTPTLADPTATATVNGVTVTSGTASSLITLTTGPNPITVVVTAQDNTTIITYAVTVTSLTHLQTWRLSYFGVADNSGVYADTADFDHNGIPNLMKYTFGLDPTSPGSNSLPQPVLSGNTLTITFTAPPGVSGVRYGAEWCTSFDPANWASITDTGSGATHIFSVSVGTNPAIFMRLKVSDP